MKLSGMSSGPAGIKIGHVEHTPKGKREGESFADQLDRNARKSKEDRVKNDLENAITMKQGKNHVNFHVEAQDDKDAAYTTSPDHTGREEETDSNGIARDIVISVPKKLALNI